MKKFFGEFKKFITRGNVLDMAVGVIVGGAFTAIVNGLSNYILKPLINWLLASLFGDGSFEKAVTFLNKVTDPTTGETDLAKSIYIDWGAFINAVINFFLIALVLFCIVKTINSISENKKKLAEDIKDKKLTKEEKKELKAAGIRIKDKAAVKAYMDEKEAKAKLAEEEAAKAKAEEELQARLANPTTEDLLKQIRDLLAQKQ